jgi:phosphatidylinositol alpha-1,6-mannosyltransferase
VITRSALVVTPSLNGADGISAVARQAVRALRRSGHRVEVICLGRDEPHELVSDPIVGATSLNGAKVRFGWSVLCRALRNPPAVVIALHLHLSPLCALLLARGTRLAVYLHGIEAWRPLNRLRRKTLQHSILLANSCYTANRFTDANPAFAGAKVQVCYPAPPPPLTPSAADVSDEPIALILGRLNAAERYKGHDEVLGLWPRVLAEVPRARLIIAGDGDDRPRLEARAHALGLTRDVTFLGTVSRLELERLLAACRCLVMPSTGEGLGLVYLEAMQAGRPCIAGTGAPEEVVVDGSTGLVVSQSTDVLYAALVRLLSDRAFASALGRAARARVESVFTEERFAQSLQASLLTAP